MTRVLIGAPIAGHKQYSINLWLSWIANQHHKEYDIILVPNGRDMEALAEKCRQIEIFDKHGQHKKPIIIPLEIKGQEQFTVIQRLTYSREIIRQTAIKAGYDYLFFLDTDTIPSTLDAIEKLIRHEKDYITGIYCYKHTRVPVVITTQHVQGGPCTNLSLAQAEEAVEKGELIRIAASGFGCTMLKNSLLQRQPFEYRGEKYSEDIAYAYQLHEEEEELWCEPLIVCRHISDDTTLEEFKNGLEIIKRQSW